jgi:hypothetical protein
MGTTTGLPEDRPAEHKDVVVADESGPSDEVVLAKEDFDKLRASAESAEAMTELVRQFLAQRIEGTRWPAVPPILEALAEDAEKNASGLPRFANRNQSRANLVTATSNALAALTGLAIWVSIQQNPVWWAKVIVAAAALLSAVLGFLPRIYRWSETAAEARRLGSEYGHLYGDLLDVKGQLLEDGADRTSSHEKIKQLRATLEGLKKQRQEINAKW